MAIFDIVGRINQEQDTTILLVERRAHMALENADYGHVKEGGRSVLEMETANLHDNEDVKEF